MHGVIRLSGPDCLAIIERTARCEGIESIGAVQFPSCLRCTMLLPRDMGIVPVVLYLWPTASSYTRQPSAELHLPGSPPVLEAALEAVCEAGATAGRPGEFTLRAFLAGRLDLTQAEAVLGVIDADSRGELDACARPTRRRNRPAAGGASVNGCSTCLRSSKRASISWTKILNSFPIANWRSNSPSLLNAWQTWPARCKREANRASSARRAIGTPNVGKSSLLNALAGRDTAIVSEIAGTTRDFVTRRVKIGDREYLMTDTAGVMPEASASDLETAARNAARQQAERSNLRLLCLDASRPLAAWEMDESNRCEEERLIVWTKCDLPHAANQEQAAAAIFTSSRTGEGIQELKQAIAQSLDRTVSEAGAVDRHRGPLPRKPAAGPRSARPRIRS